MNVRAERVGSAVILDLEGRLTVEADTRRLHELARWTTRIAASHVVLDFSNVRQLDCSGIGQLVELRNLVCESGGTFMLVNVGRRLMCLLDLVGLRPLLPVFDSRREALNWCSSAAERARELPLGRLDVVVGAARQSIDGELQHAR